jgi:hypothetical protein
MANKLPQNLFNQFNTLEDKLAEAMNNNDGPAATQANAQINAFAQANQIDLTEPVELDVGPPLPPCPEGQHRDTNGNCVPDPAAAAQMDKYLIKKRYPDAAGGKFFDNPEYKRTLNNQSTEKNIPRDTFWINHVEIMNKEITSYLNIDLIKPDQVSNKFHGGDHSDKHPKQGRCYGVGVKSDGSPHLEKEVPQHSKTPKFPNKVNLFDPNFTSINEIKGRMIGYKVCTWITPNNKVHMELHVDTDGLKADGTPSNNWKPFFWAEDDGSWQDSPYLINQGTANGGFGIDYLRIDHVGEKTKVYGRSVREIQPPA